MVGPYCLTQNLKSLSSLCFHLTKEKLHKNEHFLHTFNLATLAEKAGKNWKLGHQRAGNGRLQN